jgi:hypothetical protein
MFTAGRCTTRKALDGVVGREEIGAMITWRRRAFVIPAGNGL